MWSVGISVSECGDAERIGYDSKQINRIVIRIAQYFLNRNARVIFGHDWREDGVMRAIADFATRVASGISDIERVSERLESNKDEGPRMINIVPTGSEPLSRASRDAEHESGGVLVVSTTTKEGSERLRSLTSEPDKLCWEERWLEDRALELSMLRRWITTLLNPGCRICLGGRVEGYQGGQPGVIEEARLALQQGKPLYMLGGFGGATWKFFSKDRYGRAKYWKQNNGLSQASKLDLFNTTDIERALRIVSGGISELEKHASHTQSS